MPTKRSTRCAACTANPISRPYVTMWNSITERKVAGTAAPCPAELDDYVRRHPHIVVYKGQDGGTEGRKKRVRKRDREKERRRRERRKRDREDSEIKQDPVLVHEAGDKRVKVEPDVIPTSERVRMPTRRSATINSDEPANPVVSSQLQPTRQLIRSTNLPPRRVTLVHPFSHIALAQRFWTAEARIARASRVDNDED